MLLSYASKPLVDCGLHPDTAGGDTAIADYYFQTIFKHFLTIQKEEWIYVSSVARQYRVDIVIRYKNIVWERIQSQISCSPTQKSESTKMKQTSEMHSARLRLPFSRTHIGPLTHSWDVVAAKCYANALAASAATQLTWRVGGNSER